MSISKPPTEAERKAFVEKLQQIRSWLPESQQPLLDDLVVAACGCGGDADVHGYWFNAPFEGTTLAQVWWPYVGTATYGGQTRLPSTP